ncbi:MAG: hypothetical protein H6765_08420 [Candidatus Peribacteria bacterium]|nr:MAG: hypothetical protein H6765_08420 [Candidatus Peribacteria bacterium]
MYLKISSPEKQIYAGDIEKVTIPTEGGELTILPGHMPLSTVVKAGLVLIYPAQLPADTGYVIAQGVIHVAVSRGLLFVDGEQIIMTTSAATTSPKESTEVLTKMQQDMTLQLEKIKVEGSKEDFEKALVNLEKITADLRLAKLSHIKD